MEKALLKTLFGLDSFFELWAHFIIPHGFQNRDKLPVEDKTPGGSGQMYMLDMKDIKAAAFDELYSRLPLKDSILVIHHAVATGDDSEVHSFLENIPTRIK